MGQSKKIPFLEMIGLYWMLIVFVRFSSLFPSSENPNIIWLTFLLMCLSSSMINIAGAREVQTCDTDGRFELCA